ncbi:unnamed protein product [Nippostrongylus brasiliensis]|uniref:Integrase_SAM-like_N domain-containing protein n=1 Tax=Nippostrongylus brasiliensis TaxID=27835 RepID=A0A0N4YI73_NIPBR|nr:unnamed protein product [Nippostrongylus brasiliensis]
MGSHELPRLRRQKTHQCVSDRMLNLTLFSSCRFDSVAPLLGSTVRHIRVFVVSLFELMRQSFLRTQHQLGCFCFSLVLKFRCRAWEGRQAPGERRLDCHKEKRNETFFHTSALAQKINEGSTDDGTQFSIWLRRLEYVIRMRPVPLNAEQKANILIGHLDVVAREKPWMDSSKSENGLLWLGRGVRAGRDWSEGHYNRRYGAGRTDTRTEDKNADSGPEDDGGTLRGPHLLTRRRQL